MHAAWIVRGRVQGVWYRAFVKDHADKLGITGYAKNLPDGSVAIAVQGIRAAVLEFKKRCRQGPPRAAVTEIEETSPPNEAFYQFEIL